LEFNILVSYFIEIRKTNFIFNGFFN